ncbi:MAG: fumarylacetoacetate hydrolase family protein, partial [Comamonadaceae bacterium]
MNVDPPTAAQPAAPALVNVSIAGCAPFAGLLWQARVLALARWPQRLPHGGAGGVSRMADLVEAWPLLAEPLQALCADPQVRLEIATAGVPLGALRLHAPVQSPQVYCTIGNYRCQLLEAAADLDDGPTGAQAGARQALALGAIEQRLRGGEPYVCLKGSACLAGPHDDLPVPAAHATLDWEVEIGVVIGRRTWQVPVHDALGAVAGYCVVNDITLRERIFRQEPKVMGTD